MKLKHVLFFLFLLPAGAAAWGQQVPIPQDKWTLESVDSFQPGSEGEKAFDRDASTHWHSKWGDDSPLPHEIVLNLGASYEVAGVVYTPRPDGGNGNIKDYELYLSRDGTTWGEPVSSGRFKHRNKPNKLVFDAVKDVRYVKLVAKSEMGGNRFFAAAAEIDVLRKTTEKPGPDFSVPVPIAKPGQAVRFTDRSTVSPSQWEWSFPGGTPSSSTEQNPEVVYAKPGQYNVTLKVTNANGASTLTRQRYVTVSDRVTDMALCFDGKDSDVRTGIGIIKAPWTLEAWIKGDDGQWKGTEVLFGGGEYSRLNSADNEPLVLKGGRLCQTGSGAAADAPLDDGWHHVAATCDGKTTRLYIDGREAAVAERACAILPGALGVNEKADGVFGGLMDEVRVWSECLVPAVLNEWKSGYLTAKHPQFDHLVAYYTFDDMQEDTGVNWVGKGHLPYHLRVNRVAYKGGAPLACAVANANPHWNHSPAKQDIFNAVTIPSEWDVSPGASDDQLIKLRVAATGTGQPETVRELVIDLTGTTRLADIERLRIYDAGQAARSRQRKVLMEIRRPSSNRLVCRFPDGKAPRLRHGINYLLVTADIAPGAGYGHTIKAEIPSVIIGNSRIRPLPSTDCLAKQVFPSGSDDKEYLKVFQWNIWHGGVHLGNEGRERVLELIKSMDADVVAMQEAYGSQDMIAKGLGYQMTSASPTDNLALYSRYPVRRLGSAKKFNSNPAQIELPGGRSILVNSCWLRYASRPEYTCYYANDGMDPAVWVREDSELALKDIRYILEKDTAPHLASKDQAVIIAGDFNSCSHLDWTKKTAPLHNGYGPVPFPVSAFMLGQGYKDSFREVHPDEAERPEGTFAAIYGQLQAARIDFIYYKGSGISAVSSKIVRTPYEIDYVWPSDHAGVVTVFRLADELSR